MRHGKDESSNSNADSYHYHARTCKIDSEWKIITKSSQSLCLVSYIFIDYILMLYGARSNCTASHHVFLNNHYETEVTEYVCLQRINC